MMAAAAAARLLPSHGHIVREVLVVDGGLHAAWLYVRFWRLHLIAGGACCETAC